MEKMIFSSAMAENEGAKMLKKGLRPRRRVPGVTPGRADEIQHGNTGRGTKKRGFCRPGVRICFVRLNPIFAKNLKACPGDTMYWTLELASYLEDAPWPATKDELIDYSIRSGAPLEVVENLQELEDDGQPYESIEEIWPDYPTKEDFFFNEDEY
jgi:hypothetical protein